MLSRFSLYPKKARLDDGELVKLTFGTLPSQVIPEKQLQRSAEVFVGCALSSSPLRRGCLRDLQD